MTKGTILDKVDLELADIQGNILAGFNKDFQALLLLKFSDAAGAREWLKTITPEIANCDEVDTFNTLFKDLNSRRCGELGILKVTWTNLAFTFKGIELLGKADDSFPEEFKAGMSKRSEIIGDVGASAPGNWIEPFRSAASGDKSNELHAVLIIASDGQADLHQHVMRYVNQIGLNPAIKILFTQEGAVRADQPGHEHFGFKDGISQPGIKGFTASSKVVPDDQPHQGVPGQDLLWPGEFVLGYPTQSATPKPGFDGPNPDKGELSKSGPPWTKNGSYLVFRRLRQDVAGFHASLEKNAPSGISRELFGAKLVGRYRSGCPLERTADQPADFDPTVEDPSIKDKKFVTSEFDNNFEYGHDAKGDLVPRAAHIRKAYPRDEVFLNADGAPDPNSKLQESFTQTRRLLRRGIPYGTSFRPSLGAQEHGPGDSDDRGLLFLCYQRSIHDQFEFVQSTWVNKVDFPQQGDGADPIISQAPSAVFRASFKGAATNIDMSHFVTTTGGEYFFQPSISALKMLAGME